MKEGRAGRAQPARLHVDGRNFSLLDHDGNLLSEIENDNMTGSQEIGSNIIEDYYGATPLENRRKGYYRDLIEAALRHGYKINSDSRNTNSNAFHENFLTNLPPDITAETEAPGPGYLGPHERIQYSGKYSPGNAIGWGDLQTDSRSKVPMTYVTDYQRYRDKLNQGIDAINDIEVKGPDGVKNYVQSRLDLSMEKPVPRWWGMGETSRTGGDAWHDDGRVPMLPTNQGIGIPTGRSYEPPFHQGYQNHDINFAPSLEAGVVGIDPRRLTRQMHTDLPSPDSSRREQLDKKLMSGGTLTTQEIEEYAGQS